MRKRILFPALTLMLVLGLAYTASAGGHAWGFWGGGAAAPFAGGARAPFAGNAWRSPVDALQLTDEQIAKLQELQKAAYDKTRDLRIQLQDLMFELRLLRLQRNPDQSAINSKTEQLNNLRKQLYEIGQQNQEQMKSILTQEQLEKMTAPRGGGGRGRHGAAGRMGPCGWF
ncbi:MAG: Spy/CpxP family protein refolding chaperone [Bacillota bacterium]